MIDIHDINKRKLAGLKYLHIANEREHACAMENVLQQEISQFRYKFCFFDSSVDITPKVMNHFTSIFCTFKVF